MGSRALREHVATETAWTVERYLAAGLIICGRTNTPEFGNHCATEPALFGPTLNPWKRERFTRRVERRLRRRGRRAARSEPPRAGTAPARSGCRRPAAGWSGSSHVAGAARSRPSAGQMLDGLVIKHALTRTVRDTALLLDVIAGGAPGDPYTAPPPRAAVRAARSVPIPDGCEIMHADGPPFPGEVDPQGSGRRRPRGAGARGTRSRCRAGRACVRSGGGAPRRSRSFHAVDNAATFGWLREELGRRPEPDELEPVTWDMLREGLELTAVDHAAAIDDLHGQDAPGRARRSSRRTCCSAPTLNVLPPPPGRAVGLARHASTRSSTSSSPSTGWTAVANATGWAAITLPIGEVEGLPVGVQLLAPDEAVLLRVAAQLEQALPWADRHPPGYGYE